MIQIYQTLSSELIYYKVIKTFGQWDNLLLFLLVTFGESILRNNNISIIYIQIISNTNDHTSHNIRTQLEEVPPSAGIHLLLK